jgi:hypothetical protein
MVSRRSPSIGRSAWRLCEPEPSRLARPKRPAKPISGGRVVGRRWVVWAVSAPARGRGGAFGPSLCAVDGAAAAAARDGNRPWLDGPLALGAGCERIDTGWWDGQPVARDYYVAVTVRG